MLSVTANAPAADGEAAVPASTLAKVLGGAAVPPWMATVDADDAGAASTKPCSAESDEGDTSGFAPADGVVVVRMSPAASMFASAALDGVIPPSRLQRRPSDVGDMTGAPVAEGAVPMRPAAPTAAAVKLIRPPTGPPPLAPPLPA